MFFDQIIWDNSIREWLIALGIAIASVGILKALLIFLRSHIKKLSFKTLTIIDDIIAEVFLSTKLFFIVAVGLFIGTKYLLLSEDTIGIINTVFIVVFLLQVAIWGGEVITFITNYHREKKLQEDSASATTVTAAAFLGKLIFWSIILLLTLDNLGVNITTLVTSMGITGIAIALAVQNILGDLFASLSIIFDKPFVIGDSVKVDDFIGKIENIGLKTTRIRSLSGEELIFSNNDLLKSRIRNFKSLTERRVPFNIGVIYQTPGEILQEIPGIIKNIIEGQEFTRFDRAHFKEFGNFSLNFEVVYWILSPDYLVYMDIQQKINFEISKRFEEKKIEFAYPSQTIFIQKEGAIN